MYCTTRERAGEFFSGKGEYNQRPRGINEKQLDVGPGVNSWVGGTFKRVALPLMAILHSPLYSYIVQKTLPKL